jgi:hypothetical protein
MEIVQKELLESQTLHKFGISEYFFHQLVQILHILPVMVRPTLSSST